MIQSLTSELMILWNPRSLSVFNDSPSARSKSVTLPATDPSPMPSKKWQKVPADDVGRTLPPIAPDLVIKENEISMALISDTADDDNVTNSKHSANVDYIEGFAVERQKSRLKGLVPHEQTFKGKAIDHGNVGSGKDGYGSNTGPFDLANSTLPKSHLLGSSAMSDYEKEDHNDPIAESKTQTPSLDILESSSAAKDIQPNSVASPPVKGMLVHHEETSQSKTLFKTIWIALSHMITPASKKFISTGELPTKLYDGTMSDIMETRRQILVERLHLR